MKKIVCFSSSLSGGGAQHQMAILANLLYEKGYDVTVATYNKYADRYKVRQGIKRIEIPARGSNLKKLFIISQWIRDCNADCIISYRSPVNFILLSSLLFFKKPKIIVGERNLTILAGLREKVNHLFLYRFASYIVPNSYSQAEYLKSLNKKWSKRVRVITNYTELNYYTETKVPILQPLRIGVFSRFSKQKNCIRFAQMVSELKTQGYNNFVIHWFGDQMKKEGVWDENFVEFRELVDKLAINDICKLHPSTDAVKEEMMQCHVICMPSLYEGFSNSVSEGICIGRPMLVSNVSDNHLMVEEGVNGFLFNPYSIDSMVKAFIKMLNTNQQELEKMGRESRKKAEILFDKEKFISQYINLIEK